MDFAAMFQTWMNVITKPGEATFEAERHQPQANLTTALIWIVIAAVVLAIGNAIGALIGSLIGGGGASMTRMFLDQANLPPEVVAQLRASAAGGAGGVAGAFCGALIAAPIFFLIGSGIYFLIARLFGGTGTFEEQTYLLAASAAPITIVSGLVGIIPLLGGCVGLLLAIYQLVLNYFALKVTHGLTSGKASAVVLIPVAIFFLCICLGAVGFVILIGAVVNNAR